MIGLNDNKEDELSKQNKSLERKNAVYDVLSVLLMGVFVLLIGYFVWLRMVGEWTP